MDKNLKESLLLNSYKIWIGDDYDLSKRVQQSLFNIGLEWGGMSKKSIHPETESGDIKAILIDRGKMIYDSSIRNQIDFNGSQGIGYLELDAKAFEEEEVDESEIPDKFKKGNIIKVHERGKDKDDFYYGKVARVVFNKQTNNLVVKLYTLMEDDDYEYEVFVSEGGWHNFYSPTDESKRFTLRQTDPKLKRLDKVEIVNATGLFKKYNGKIGEIVGVYNDSLQIDLEGTTMTLPFGIDEIKLSEKPTPQLEDDDEIKKDGLVNAFFEKNKDKLKRIFEKNPKTHKKLIESLDKLAEYEECTIKKPSNEESIQEAKSRLMESILNLK